MTELEAEILLLRDENARLRTEREQLPDPGSIVERVRALGSDADSPGEVGDEAWQVLAEGLALRDALVDVCVEVAQAAACLEARLRSMAPHAVSYASDLAEPDGAERTGRFPRDNGTGASAHLDSV